MATIFHGWQQFSLSGTVLRGTSFAYIPTSELSFSPLSATHLQRAFTHMANATLESHGFDTSGAFHGGSGWQSVDFGTDSLNSGGGSAPIEKPQGNIVTGQSDAFKQATAGAKQATNPPATTGNPAMTDYNQMMT